MPSQAGSGLPARVCASAIAVLLSVAVAGPARAQDENPVERLGGADRYGTAARVLEAVQADYCRQPDVQQYDDCDNWATMAHVTYVRGDDFADALSAVNVSGQVLTTTRRDDLPDVIAEVIARHTMATSEVARLVGDEGVVGPQVEAEILAKGLADPEKVFRYGGPDRYDTNLATVRAVFEGCATDEYVDVSFDRLVVVRGDTWPDGLAAGQLIRDYYGCSAILLTHPDRLPDAARGFLAEGSDGDRPLRRDTDIVVVGGPSAVSDDVVAELAELTPGDTVPRRVAGVDRQGTARAIAREWFQDGCLSQVRHDIGWRCGVTIVRPDDFADAIVAPALMWFRGSAVLIAHSRDELGADNEAFIREWADDIDVVTVLGSTDVLGPAIEQQARTALKG